MASFETNCTYCGKLYTAQRSTSKYCSSKCRQAANRVYYNKINVTYEVLNAIDHIKRLEVAGEDELLSNAAQIEKLLIESNRLKEKLKRIADCQWVSSPVST